MRLWNACKMLVLTVVLVSCNQTCGPSISDYTGCAAMCIPNGVEEVMYNVCRRRAGARDMGQ